MALVAPWLCLTMVAQAAPHKTDQRDRTQRTLLVWGDSLSAGFGLDAGQDWVTLLQQRIDRRGLAWHVVNGSVSGETTAGGLRRLPAALRRNPPTIVLIELGANDGLRGQPLTVMRQNLTKMIALSRQAGATPLLFEMRLPPNYGEDFTAAFRQSFHTVASQTGTRLVPFFMASIAGDRSNFQPGGLHPVAAAEPRLMEAVWSSVAPLLKASPPAAAASRSGPTP